MKHYTVILSVALLSVCVACNSGRPKQLHENLPKMKTIQKVGVLLRIHASSPVEQSRYVSTLKAMLAGYQQKKEIYVISDDMPALTKVASNDDRFYQTSLEGDFLIFKATGIVNSYCFKNKGALQSLFEKHEFDLLVLYEPYGVVSYGMGFIDYDSVMVIIDKNCKIVYFDYNHDRKETNEFSTDVLWDLLLNEVNTRSMKTFQKLGFVQ